MAFKTLAQLRNQAAGPSLNFELGLESDADNTWGDTVVRNAYLTRALEGLWPRAARLVRENILTVSNVIDYTLASLYDIERLEVLDIQTGTLLDGRIRSWQLIVDESADPVVRRLLIPNGLIAGLTVRCIGYAPYAAPTADGGSTDIPAILESTVVAGARLFAYRRKLSQYANFEKMANENRANALTAADLIELMRQAKSDWDAGLRDHSRDLAGARRARLQTT